MNIIQALSAGFTVDNVLDLLSPKYPNVAGKLKSAQRHGYDVQKFLRTFQGASKKDLQSMEDRAKNSSNPLISGGYGSKRNSAQTFVKEKALPAAAALGTAALGAYGAARGIPAVAQGLSGLMGSPSSPAPPQGIVPPSNSNIGPKPLSGAPVQSAPVQGGGQVDIGAAAQAMPDQIQPPSVQSPSILEQMGLKQRIDALKQAGNDSEVISSILEKFLTPGQKKWLSDQKAPPLRDLVKEYLNGPTEDVLKQEVESPQISAPQVNETDEELEVKPAKKGSLVATPHGIVGTIRDQKETEALVDSDGKLHKAKTEDLIESPLPEKELADLYNEVVQGIEKQTGEEVSRNVNWAGYDPKTNTLAYLPHLGSFYTYENIEPEEAKLLTSILSTRKTSGENFIGAWAQGSKSPIGAAMSALIKKLQAESGGKGKEYSHKFETLYNALEPAIKAAKKKKSDQEKIKRKK